jgi:hypothetical protein
VTAPASLSVPAGTTQTLGGVSVADSAATGDVTVVLSDHTGLLNANTASGIAEQGEGTTTLTLTGALAAINADLTTLTYQAAATAGTDALAVSATAGGSKGASSVAITVGSSAAPAASAAAEVTSSALTQTTPPLGTVINTATLTQSFNGVFTNGFTSSPDGSTGLWATSMIERQPHARVECRAGVLFRQFGGSQSVQRGEPHARHHRRTYQ